MSKPVQVFIIMGQSNTLEMGKVKGDKEGSLEYAVKSENLYPFMVDDSGNWSKRMDVRNVHTQGSGGPGGRGGVRRNDWLTVSGGKIGIEQGIGHHLGDALDAPVLVLKSSIGNRSLGWDLLPPGSPRHEVVTTDKKTGNKVTLVTPAHNDEVRHPSWTKGEKCLLHRAIHGMPDCNIWEMWPVRRKYCPNWTNIIPEQPSMKLPDFYGGRVTRIVTTKLMPQCMVKTSNNFSKHSAKSLMHRKPKMVVATLGQTNKEKASGNEKLIIDGMFAFGDSHKGDAAVVYTNPISMGSSSNAHYGGNAKTYMNVGLAMGEAMVKLIKK